VKMNLIVETGKANISLKYFLKRTIGNKKTLYLRSASILL